MWGATIKANSAAKNGEISIHAPRVGRDRKFCREYFAGMISIHAPRVGRDVDEAVDTVCAVISIHAPRVGRDRILSCVFFGWRAFQSTRPVWGATQP